MSFLARKNSLLALIFAAAIVPQTAMACACGCTVFDVGTSSLLPNGPGGTAFLEYDLLDQTRNWSGASSAPKRNNDDKRIRSNFYQVGAEYMFDDEWGAMAEVPYIQRAVASTDTGALEVMRHGSIGDLRLTAVYSGFSPDMSTGAIFGMKLPTGDSNAAGFDSDTQAGTGSTDLLLGAYHSGQIGSAGDYVWYAQAMWQHEVATRHHYTPGSELNSAIGASYNNWSIGGIHVAPALQAVVSYRGHDGGAVGEPDSTGYTRALIAPGVAFSHPDGWKLYADVEMPVWQHVTGNQLVAPVALKFIVSRAF